MSYPSPNDKLINKVIKRLTKEVSALKKKLKDDFWDDYDDAILAQDELKRSVALLECVTALQKFINVRSSPMGGSGKLFEVNMMEQEQQMRNMFEDLDTLTERPAKDGKQVTCTLVGRPFVVTPWRKGRVSWADEHRITKDNPTREAYCQHCSHTAAVRVRGRWRCGSCGNPAVMNLALNG